MPEDEHKDDWMKCFDQFVAFSPETRSLIRHHAAAEMVSFGAEEVGSSDVNHFLFGKWLVAHRDWSRVIMYFVDNAV
jgi:hypothetical protein